MAKLLVTLPNTGDRTHELTGDIITIGRTPDNKVQISHDSIASHHARLVRTNGQYRLKALSSTGTSCVNGTPVTDAILNGSCILQLGSIECLFKDENAQTPADKLHTHLSEARRQIESLLRARDALHEQNRELVKQRDTAQEARDLVDDELSEAGNEIEHLKKNLLTAAAENGNFEEKRRQSADGRQKEIAAIKAELDAAQMECASAKEEREKSEAALKTTRKNAARAEAERTDLTKRVADAQKQIDSLTLERDTARSSESGASGELARAREDLARLSGKVEAAGTERVGVEAKLAGVERELEALQRDRDASVEKLNAELGAAQSELETARTADRSATVRVEALTAEAATHRNELAALNQARDEARQACAGLEERLNGASEQVKQLSETQAGQGKLAADNEKLRRMLEDTHLEHKNFAKRTFELNAEIEKLREKCGAHDQESAGVETARRDLESRLTATEKRLETAVGERNEVIQKVSGELAAAKADLESTQAAVKTAETLRAELGKMEGDLAASMQQRDDAERQHTELLGKMSEAKTQTEAITGELDAARRHDEELVLQLAQLRTELAAEAQHREQSQSASADLSARLGALDKEAAAGRTERDAVSQENLALVGKIEGQNKQLSALMQAAEAARKRSDELSTSLGDARQRLGELSDAALLAQAHSSELTEQLSSNRSQVKELTKQRDALLETTARLAGEIEAASARASERPQAPAPLAISDDTASEPASPVPSAASSESILAAPPELTSWLKRALHKRKSPEEPAVAPAANGEAFPPPAPRRFSPPPAADIEDAHSVSLDFLGAEPDSQPLALLREAAHVESARALDVDEAEPEPRLAPRPPPTPVAATVHPPNPEAVKPALPEKILEMRRALQYFIRHPGEGEMLQNLWRSSLEMTEITEKAGYALLHSATTSFEMFARDLHQMPSRVSPSTLRTVGQSVDFLQTLLEDAHLQRLITAQPMKAIAIEDEPDVLEAIVAALEMVGLKTCATKQAKPALALLSAQKFDLIFLDVGLPDMNGLELCGKIRGMAQHCKTPIVFLTGMTTVEHRAQSTLKGGNDFIAKPFYLSELSMKAITWALKGHLGMVLRSATM